MDMLPGERVNSREKQFSVNWQHEKSLSENIKASTEDRGRPISGVNLYGICRKVLSAKHSCTKLLGQNFPSICTVSYISSLLEYFLTAIFHRYHCPPNLFSRKPSKRIFFRENTQWYSYTVWDLGSVYEGEKVSYSVGRPIIPHKKLCSPSTFLSFHPIH